MGKASFVMPSFENASGSSKTPLQPLGELRGELPPPPGLRATTVELGTDEYLVLSFPTPGWELPPSLSPSERDVAAAILQGLSNAQIAAQRRTSVRTIANQIASIFGKLGVASRTEFAYAVGAGKWSAEGR